MPEVLLEVKELRTSFRTREGLVPAVNRISFQVKRGETLCIVGESGSGKSVTSLSIIGLLDSPGRETAGEIRLKGRNLLDLSKHEMRKIRGSEISMIFQEPMTSLNPVFTVGSQIAEALRTHAGLSRKEARLQSMELLRIVGIPSPEKAVHYFPHQLSGGMRQRVMIASALSCNPSLLIADEPTTALDVTVQAQILETIKELSGSRDMGVILITHDLGIVAEMADRVMVMYAGEIVEEAPVSRLFDEPLHPYTSGLLRSLPRIHEEQEELYSIKGSVPGLHELPRGCAFQRRCPYAVKRCETEKPELERVHPDHAVRCFYPLIQGGES
ncbi:ABC transporter ATP-binding protein [Paenibacillus macerans]|uniref:ABC transporter ATP-binding protein n=1 Tax=Paenibacillus macerans TaxID=44252 RepID=UPI00203B51E1|nr:ABC transporter ATP-binding protein [Paenibacillus macerans]MCM3699621.1 ABC transporter ATP-binding protein [Paenibacillus macerans]